MVGNELPNREFNICYFVMCANSQFPITWNDLFVDGIRKAPIRIYELNDEYSQ